VPASVRQPVRDTVSASPAAAPATYRLALAVIVSFLHVAVLVETGSLVLDRPFEVLGSYLEKGISNEMPRDISHGASLV
jgi:hypothetical protein